MKSPAFILMMCLGYINMDNSHYHTRCSNRATIVFVIPLSDRKSTLAVYIEDFLLQLVNYFEISQYDYKIQILEYNQTYREISQFLTTRKSANSEISTIGVKRSRYPAFGIYLKPVIEEAVYSLNVTSEQFRKKIILIFLTGHVLDKTAALSYADELKQSGIIFYVITSFRESLDVALNIASDPCKTFLINDFKSGMDDMIGDLGNNICLASDPGMFVTSGPDTLGNCNIDTKFHPPEIEMNYYCPKDGLFPDSTNCAYFYKCTRGSSVHLKCEDGTMFDANTETCNHKMAVSCYTGVTCPGSTGLFPYPGDCYKFLNCFEGLPYVQSCPGGLVFDKIVKRCLLPNQALC